MKCELKYVLHDLMKILKTSPVCFIIAFLCVCCTRFLFGDIGFIVLSATSCVIFTKIYYSESKEYCKKKEINNETIHTK